MQIFFSAIRMLKIGVVLVVALYVCNVNCLSDKEESDFMEAMKPIAADCARECGLGDDYKEYKKGDDVDPCFKRCFMKKIGILDDKGKYNRKSLHDSISQYAGDKDELMKAQEKLDSCFDANGDNDGDDEDSEIKRVEVLYQCMKEMKEQA